jgi:hypothetical protein
MKPKKKNTVVGWAVVGEEEDGNYHIALSPFEELVIFNIKSAAKIYCDSYTNYKIVKVKITYEV